MKGAINQMNNDIVEQTAKKLDFPVKILFTFAYFYVESPHTRDFCQKEYVYWTKTGKYSRAVEDLCLDVLSGRVVPLKGMPAIEAYRKALEIMKKPVVLRKAD